MVDAPLKSEEVEVVEEEDHVDSNDIVPRQRALPTYIKKEAPIIRFTKINILNLDKRFSISAAVSLTDLYLPLVILCIFIL